MGADTRLSQATVEELLPARLASSLPSHFSLEESEYTLILIVEDNSQMRQFLSEQLSSRYCVVEAANGQEGLALARQMHPDLILTDMMMPVMSGDEMLITLRADPTGLANCFVNKNGVLRRLKSMQLMSNLCQ